MSLSSLQTDAFLAVVKKGSFSAAAEALHITQSALSQRILNLEQTLETSLFIREHTGVRLTEFGHDLFRFCHSKDLLEEELLLSLKTSSKNLLSGSVKIAGFSTIVRSVLIPVIGKLVRTHPKVDVEILTAELRDLPGLLASGRADFIFATQLLDKAGVENIKIGHETNVLIQAKSGTFRNNIYLDHDQEDRITTDFFRLQGKKNFQIKRNYFDEVYSIIEGVKQGLGLAVVPLHIAQNSNGIEIIEGYKPLHVPIYFTYYSQSYYTNLQKIVIETIQELAPKYLIT